MALPKQRHTHFRRDRARKFLELKPQETVSCPKCGGAVTSHRACPKCGTYRGREIVKVTPKMKKEKAA